MKRGDLVTAAAGSGFGGKPRPALILQSDAYPTGNLVLALVTSSLIAAEQTGRRAYLMELDALYCDVIVQRWEKFSGRKADRVSPVAA